MENIAAALQAAGQCVNAGELARAEQIYRQVLLAQPRHAQALHGLARTALRAGKPELAIEHVSTALGEDRSVAAFYVTLGEAYRGLGRLDEATAAFREAVRLEPNSAEFHFRLGAVLENRGDAAGAGERFAEALRLAPDYVDAALHLGQTLFVQGRLAEAAAQFEDIARRHPEAPWAHCGLGIVHYGQGNLDLAIACYRRAIEINPNFAEAHFNLGTALHVQDRLPEAIACFEAALRTMPSLAAAHVSLATSYLLLVRPDEALAASRRAVELAPRSSAAYSQLGSALQMQGDMDGALAAMRRAVELNPADAGIHSNLVYALNFHPGYDAAAVFAEHRAWAQRHAEPLTAAAAAHDNDRTLDRPLRVGYVSAHFREHAVSFFGEPVIAAHDPAQFEVYCYSDVRGGDVVTQRFRARAEVWREIAGWTDARVAEQVRHDKIDILVDLAGHIGGNRLLVFARKPAPVQVTYLGYQNTTGMSAIDYRVTDAHADPPELTDAFYTERLVRLPRSFFCFAPSDPSPPVNALPALAGGGVTFASLNHINKLTPRALETWARILAAVPNARLMVLAYAPGRLEANVRMIMAREGIDPGRVTVVNKRPRQEYLRLHHELDIALDTFPFNGHTTVCDALWMGVPSIMLEGSSYASRFGGSALVNLGLETLIATSVEQYVEIAVALAADLPRLAELRRSFRARMRASPLLDAAGFTRDLEAAYRWMWHGWCQAGSTPSSRGASKIDNESVH